MSNQPQRKTLKQQTVEDQRRRMNQRRHDLTERIRKKKRAHLVDTKRRYVAINPSPSSAVEITSSTVISKFELPKVSGSATADSSTIEPISTPLLENLAWSLIRNQDSTSLAALQEALVAPEADANNLFNSMNSAEDSTAFLLANALTPFVLRSSTDECLLACRILTNLAAADRKETEEGYYGRQPESWCDVLIRSPVVAAVVNTIIKFTASIQNSSSPPVERDKEILEQCCWFIGNIAGDSQMGRATLRNLGLFQPLVLIFKQALEWKLPFVAKHSVWAIANIVRGDVTAPAFTFCSPSLLTSEIFSTGLVLAEQLQEVSSVYQVWLEVAEEVASVVAECTSREDETLVFLSSPANQLAEALAFRLTVSANVLSNSSTPFEVEVSWRHLRTCLSCLNAVGNIANSCNGAYVASLLLMADRTLIVPITRLLELGLTNKDAQSVACGAAWVAGALLCDVGIRDHPSTTVAAPALLPVLCKSLPHATMDLQREIVSALSNALHDPPTVCTDQQRDSQLIPVDKKSFIDISVFIAKETSTVAQLVQILQRSDHFAALAAIQVLRTILRLVPSFQIYFAEVVGGVSILEDCCERWGSQVSHSYGAESVADVAADLLDAFFSQDEELLNDNEEENAMDMASASNRVEYALEDHFTSERNYSQYLVSASQSQVGGRGRGRGKQIPAWMQSSK